MTLRRTIFLLSLMVFASPMTAWAEEPMGSLGDQTKQEGANLQGMKATPSKPTPTAPSAEQLQPLEERIKRAVEISSDSTETVDKQKQTAPSGEIRENKWSFVIAAYLLSWLALVGYLLSLRRRGL